MAGGHSPAGAVEQQAGKQARINNVATLLPNDAVLLVLPLRPFEDLWINDRRMLAWIVLTAVVHLTDVGPVLDEMAQGAVREIGAAGMSTARRVP
jgi:hypothetical protein